MITRKDIVDCDFFMKKMDKDEVMVKWRMLGGLG